MPRFYFHLHNHIHSIDEEGTELPDLEAARGAATKSARELISEEIRTVGTLNLSHWIEVENENGQQVLAVYFRECVEVIP